MANDIVLDGSSPNRLHLFNGHPYDRVDFSKTNLLAYWKLDETSGTTVYDSYDGGYDGTFTDGSMNANGKINYCYYLNDSASLAISLGNVFNFERTDTWTINAWIKRDGKDVFDSVFAKINAGASYQGHSFAISQSNALKFDLINNYSTNALVVESTGTITDTNWHMVTVSYDGGSAASGVRFYIDGVSTSNASPVKNNLSATTVTSSSLSCAIGSSQNGTKGLRGYLDEVSVWGAVISESNVKALYNAYQGNAIYLKN